MAHDISDLPLPPGRNKRLETKRKRPGRRKKPSMFKHFKRVVMSEHSVLSMIAVFIGTLTAVSAFVFRSMIQVLKDT